MGQWIVLLLASFFAWNFASVYTSNVDFDTLRFVQIIFRHGKRTPVKFLKNDPSEHLWNGVLGQLTNDGKKDSYELGKWFRQRYDGFISEFANDREVSIKSTSIDRTLETAQLFAAGVYPPKTKEVWNKDLGTQWQPYPIYPLNLYSENNFCARLDQMQKMLENTPEEVRLYNKHKDLINRMLLELGEEQDKKSGFFHAFDNLMIERSMRLPIPKWIAKDINNVEILLNHYSKNIIKTPEITRLNIGDLTKKLMIEMLTAKQKRVGELKVSAYSAHDSTLIPLMASMNIFNYIWPPFSAALIIELHEKTNDDYFLKVLYKNDTTQEPQVLKFPDCSEKCPWFRAWELTSWYFVNDKSAACKSMGREEATQKQEELNKSFP